MSADTITIQLPKDLKPGPINVVVIASPPPGPPPQSSPAWTPDGQKSGYVFTLQGAPSPPKPEDQVTATATFTCIPEARTSPRPTR